MKIFILNLLIIIAFSSTYAQNTSEYGFTGTIQLLNNEVITYKLNFKKQANGKITGTSLTDVYGENRTSSNIIGSISEENNTISFKETKNISTKSTSAEEEFCYIELNDAKIKTVKNKTIIQGFFIGKFSSGKKCASGNVYLISTNYLNENIDTLKTNKNIVAEKIVQASKIELRGKEEFKINWTSKEIIIEIWDGEREDLDEVEIYINNNRVLDRLILKQKKKILVLPFSEETCVLRIVGKDEGTSAPCTANILLRDNMDATPIVAVLKKGESAIIRLVRKDKK